MIERATRMIASIRLRLGGDAKCMNDYFTGFENFAGFASFVHFAFWAEWDKSTISAGLAIFANLEVSGPKWQEFDFRD